MTRSSASVQKGRTNCLNFFQPSSKMPSVYFHSCAKCLSSSADFFLIQDWPISKFEPKIRFNWIRIKRCNKFKQIASKSWAIRSTLFSYTNVYWDTFESHTLYTRYTIKLHWNRWTSRRHLYLKHLWLNTMRRLHWKDRPAKTPTRFSWWDIPVRAVHIFKLIWNDEY